MISAFDLLLRARRTASLLILAAGMTALPRDAGAEPSDPLTRTAARELALEGAQLFEQGDYAKALDRFRRAFALFPAPSISIMQARSLARLGNLVEALDKYEETLRMPLAESASEAFRQAVADAAVEAEELRPRIPRLIVEIEPGTRELAGFAVSLDGKRIPSALFGIGIPVNPGPHTLRAVATARVPSVRNIQLSEHGRELVHLNLGSSVAPVRAEADTSAGTPTVRMLGWTALGVGVLGLGTSTVTGVIALGKKSDLDAACRPGCPASAEGDIDAFRTHRTLSYVSLGVGAVALGVGAYVLLGDRAESPRVGARLTPSGAALAGVF